MFLEHTNLFYLFGFTAFLNNTYAGTLCCPYPKPYQPPKSRIARKRPLLPPESLNHTNTSKTDLKPAIKAAGGKNHYSRY